MSLTNASKFIQNISRDCEPWLKNPHVHQEVVQRFYSKHRQKSLQTHEEKDKCQDKRCNVKEKKPFWKIFKTKREKDLAIKRDIEEVCKRQKSEALTGDEPDLSEFGDQAFKTCGQAAFVVQKETVRQAARTPTRADKILENMEKHPDLKGVEDPMPAFESVEQRLLDLSERKLHPFYKVYMSTPKKPTLTPPKFEYKTRSGPVCRDEIPDSMKFNKELLDKKNIFSEFKRVEPPQQLMAKMIEMKQNERPTLERKNKPKKPCDKEEDNNCL